MARALFERAFHEGLESLYPPICWVCGAELEAYARSGSSSSASGPRDPLARAAEARRVVGGTCPEHPLPERPPGARCGRCQARLPAAFSDGETCSLCRVTPPRFGRVVALGDYRQASLRAWILAWKHGGRQDLTLPLAEALRGRVESVVGGSARVRGIEPAARRRCEGKGKAGRSDSLRAEDGWRRGSRSRWAVDGMDGARLRVRSRWKRSRGRYPLGKPGELGGDPGGEGDSRPWLVPIPLHALRRLERGFDQAGQLARALGESMGWPVRQALVRRTFTLPQGAPGALDRVGNLRGAFGLEPDDREALRGRDVVLIDDVLTSGATLDEAARCLRRGGARRIDAWVLACARGDG